jgi:hypothetical protein
VTLAKSLTVGTYSHDVLYLNHFRVSKVMLISGKCMAIFFSPLYIAQ